MRWVVPLLGAVRLAGSSHPGLSHASTRASGVPIACVRCPVLGCRLIQVAVTPAVPVPAARDAFLATSRARRGGGSDIGLAAPGEMGGFAVVEAADGQRRGGAVGVTRGVWMKANKKNKRKRGKQQDGGGVVYFSRSLSWCDISYHSSWGVSAVWYSQQDHVSRAP